MLVLLALVQVQTGQSGSADNVLGKHTLDGQLHCELGALSHQLVVLDFLQVADPSGVMVVGFLIELTAGQDRLVHVDDDDEIAAVNIGREVNLMLAAQKSGGGHSGAAQRLAVISVGVGGATPEAAAAINAAIATKDDATIRSTIASYTPEAQAAAAQAAAAQAAADAAAAQAAAQAAQQQAAQQQAQTTTPDATGTTAQ